MAFSFPIASIPGESDFAMRAAPSLDEASAMKFFLGKTHEEALALFRDNFLHHQEDLMWMASPAFRFYLAPALDFICNDPAADAGDLGALCSVLEFRLDHISDSFVQIEAPVADAVRNILCKMTQFERGSPVGFDVPERYEAILARLDALRLGQAAGKAERG